MARGRRMGGCRWPPRMHHVLRLCIKRSPGHVNYKDNKNTQNVRNAAPVHEKMPIIGDWLDVGGSPECTKYCACAAELLRCTVNPRLANEIWGRWGCILIWSRDGVEWGGVLCPRTPVANRPKGLRNVGLWASPRLRLLIVDGKYYELINK